MKSIKVSEFFKNTYYCILLSWKYSPQYFIVRILLCIFPPLLTITISYYTKEVVNELISTSKLLYPFLLLSLITVFRIILKCCQSLDQYVQGLHAETINLQVTRWLITKNMNVDLAYFDNTEYQDAFIFASRNLSALSQVIWNTLTIISLTISTLLSATLIVFENWQYAIITIISAIPTSVCSIYFTKRIHLFDQKNVSIQRELSYIQSIATTREYAASLRLYGVQEWLTSKLIDKSIDYLQAKKKQHFFRCIISNILNCIPEITIGLIGFHVAYLVTVKDLPAGDFLYYTGLVSQLWTNTYGLINAIVQIINNQLKVQSIRKLEAFENCIQDLGTLHLSRIDSIEFDNVSFQYPGTHYSVLHDISFKITSGETVALIGSNGSGKTTVYKLLLRFYEPTTGEIRINGIPISEYTLSSLRKCFSSYFQDELNYAFSVRENIVLSDPSCIDTNSDDYILSLFNSVFPDFFSKDNLTLDTILSRSLSPNGKELSGGEHQKIAILRTLYRPCSTLLLDEPTANLDPESSSLLLNLLQEKSSERITIITSHYLNNIRSVSRVIVLKNGTVVEDGSPSNLLAK